MKIKTKDKTNNRTKLEISSKYGRIFAWFSYEKLIVFEYEYCDKNDKKYTVEYTKEKYSKTTTRYLNEIKEKELPRILNHFEPKTEQELQTDLLVYIRKFVTDEIQG